VLNILSLLKDPTWSRAELNDGSWEFGMPVSEVDNFQKLVRGVSSNAKIDLEYNPLSVPDHDVTYFGFPAAHSLNGTWLEERVEYIYGTPKYFYMILICIQKLISAFMDIVPLSV
jgi:hypothetical protein